MQASTKKYQNMQDKVKKNMKNKIKICIMFYVVNMEDLDCLRLDKLYAEDNLPYCIFHMKLNPKQCIEYKLFGTYSYIFILLKIFVT